MKQPSKALLKLRLFGQCLLLGFFLTPVMAVGQDSDDEVVLDKNSPDFLDLLSEGNYDLWGCSPIKINDEGDPIENGYIRERDEKFNILKEQHVTIKAIVTIFHNHGGFAQVAYGNTIYPVPDGGRFYTNQYSEKENRMMGTIENESNTNTDLKGGTEFGAAGFAWILDRDKKSLIIGTDAYEIEIYEGCELATSEE